MQFLIVVTKFSFTGDRGGGGGVHVRVLAAHALRARAASPALAQGRARLSHRSVACTPGDEDTKCSKKPNGVEPLKLQIDFNAARLRFGNVHLLIQY
jgi:hypothetical protein